jgi:hypothetical protein
MVYLEGEEPVMSKGVFGEEKGNQRDVWADKDRKTCRI